MSTPRDGISSRMREQRMRLGLSQEAVARRIGDTTMRTYARWERSESYGYMHHLAEIAKALETTEELLLGGETLESAMPSVEEISAKLDIALGELAQIRKDLALLINERR